MDGYRGLAQLDMSGKTIMVKSDKDNKLYVKKAVTEDAAKIYKKLINKKCSFLAEIFDVKYDTEIYVIQEYIEGTNLKEYIEKNGVMDEETAYSIISDVLYALTFLHSRGIVHRDINPNNVMINEYMDAKTIDLGISRKKGFVEPRDTHIMGTVGYIAPEQYGFRQSTEQSDIYSAGVLLNFLLTGKTVKEYKYNGRLTPVIEKCTRISSEKRYINCSEVRYAMKSCLQHRGIYRILRYLPGFRTQSILKAAVTIIFGYVPIIVIAAFLTAAFINKDTPEISAGICILFFAEIPAFLIGSNIGYYQDRLPIIRELPVPIRRIIFVVLSVAICFINLIIANILLKGK